ncbi:hypothetical protein PVAP13_9KG584801 [Panicum virgatum]|uniref:Uncharacterized protein n=1 Tax=Panicum virgatum TaxID=38727 RepID=A0A8T0P695_PANVG|nr:hypothetical protein PVAP13_9KG584801 [Panicum virgatum]
MYIKPFSYQALTTQKHTQLSSRNEHIQSNHQNPRMLSFPSPAVPLTLLLIAALHVAATLAQIPAATTTGAAVAATNPQSGTREWRRCRRRRPGRTAGALHARHPRRLEPDGAAHHRLARQHLQRAGPLRAPHRLQRAEERRGDPQRQRPGAHGQRQQRHPAGHRPVRCRLPAAREQRRGPGPGAGAARPGRPQPRVRHNHRHRRRADERAGPRRAAARARAGRVRGELRRRDVADDGVHGHDGRRRVRRHHQLLRGVQGGHPAVPAVHHRRHRQVQGRLRVRRGAPAHRLRPARHRRRGDAAEDHRPSRLSSS